MSGKGPLGGSRSGDDSIHSLRALIIAGERYRQAIADHLGLGVTESKAVNYLTVNGDRGQNELAADLGLSNGASTALVDRLERQGIGERYPHPRDRRKTLVRLTPRGREVVQECRRWLTAALPDVSDQQLRSVASILQTIADRLGDQSSRLAEAEVWRPHSEPAVTGRGRDRSSD